jgi:hypothetical protein
MIGVRRPLSEVDRSLAREAADVSFEHYLTFGDKSRPAAHSPIWRVKARQEGRLRTRSASDKMSPTATRTRETALAVWVKLAQVLVKSPDAKDRQLAGAIARFRAADAGSHRTHAQATEREAARASRDAISVARGTRAGAKGSGHRAVAARNSAERQIRDQ